MHFLDQIVHKVKIVIINIICTAQENNSINTSYANLALHQETSSEKAISSSAREAVAP